MVETICLFPRNHIENLPLLNTPNVAVTNAGLTNQLFALANGVLTKKNSNILIIDSFLTSVDTGFLCRVSDVIDLEETSKLINQIPSFEKIRLVDRLDIDSQNFPQNIFSNGASDFGWYNQRNEQVFLKILNSIVFSKKINDIASQLKEQLKLQNVNVIQLRVEDDGIRHWASRNQLSEDAFKFKLYEKYSSAFDQFFSNGLKNLVLTGSNDKISEVFQNTPEAKFISVSQELKTSLLESNIGFSGRELRAAIDLLLGLKCGVNFLGCHSYQFSRGSSFGWYLSKNIKGNIILIDLDRIDNPLEINPKKKILLYV